MAILSSYLKTFRQLLFGFPAEEGYKPQTAPGEIIRKNFDKVRVRGELHAGKESEFNAETHAEVRKQPGKDFVIMNFADIHFSDFGYRIPFSIPTQAYMNRLVKKIKPDMIILSGDMVCSDASFFSIRRLTDIMESFDIPWAPLMGNHDSEGNCDRNFLADIMMKGPHCLMKKGPSDAGVGNYTVDITEGENTVHSLVLIDSYKEFRPDATCDWYEKATEGVEGEISVHMHIPPAEEVAAWDEVKTSGGTKTEKPGCYGECHEEICPQGKEEGSTKNLFDVIRNSGAGYIFSSHDHMNNFSVPYEGVRMTQCMKIGKGSGFQHGFNGTTLIKISSAGISEIRQITKKFGVIKTLYSINCR